MNADSRKVKGQAEVIFFDAAGTLIQLVHPAGWHYAEIARRHGVEAEATLIEASFRKIWKAQLPRPPSLSPREADDRPWWKALAIRVLRDSTRLPPDFRENQWFDELYLRFSEPGVWKLHEDVAPCLARLRQRHRLSVLSNFDGRLRPILEDLGIAAAFEHLFISSELGCEKPHPEIFCRALAVMRVEPQKCLHVGDDPVNDRSGAEGAGLESFLLHRPGVSLQDLRP